MIEISIIVPVYNLEKYLIQCVDSISEQSFTNFELILVNDGSTDKSGDICDRYAKQDSRIKVIHRNNGGVASSRNAGLEIARGKYIGFVDNDDYINKYMFEILYNNAIYYSSDIVVCNYLEVIEGDSHNIKQMEQIYDIKNYNNKEALNQLYMRNNITFTVPWNKLYKRELFKDIKYKVGNSNDDETVAHKLLYYSDKVTFVRADLYYYTQRKGSQMDSNTFHIKKLDAIYALKDREIFFRKIKEHQLHQKALLHYMERFFRYYYLAKHSLSDIDEELKAVKKTYDKTVIYILRHKEIGWKQKTMCIVFLINPLLFELIKENVEKYNKKKRSNA